jgi:hypothetical protein
MRSLIVLSCLLLGQSVVAESQVSTIADHTHWVEQVLKEMQSIKVGMRRGEVEKVFSVAGGLATVSRQAYVYRQCPYFRVDVEFAPADQTRASENDTVVNISKPYLDWPHGD